MAAKTKESPKDTLDQFAEAANADPKKAIQLLLWKARHENPDMVAMITEQDVAGFEASCAYLEVAPDVQIVRPKGMPPRDAVPAEGKRRAVPAFSGEAPRPFVVVSLVKKGTKDQIKPIESTEDGAQRRDESAALRKMRDGAPALAGALLADLAANQFSSATIREAAAALQVLARSR